MAFLFLFFTVALSLCVVGLIVLALASILGSVRDDWKIEKNPNESRDRETTDRPRTFASHDSGGGKWRLARPRYDLDQCARIRRSRRSSDGDNSEIAGKSADADEWHHNFCLVVPIRFRRDCAR